MRSLYAQVAAVFLVLLVGLGAVGAWWVARQAIGVTEAADQVLNRDLAGALVPRFEPYLESEIDLEGIAAEIERLTMVNRRMDVYLLGPEGMIKGSVLTDAGEPLMGAVDPAPLDAFIGGASLPILGEDPARPERRAPFSAAPISIMGEEGCYLYLVLSGTEYARAVGMLSPTFLTRGTLYGLLAALLATALVGLLLFRRLTRPLAEVTAAARALEAGALDRRVPVEGPAEVAGLGTAFNAMADRVSEHVDALERQDRLRREIVANVSHDLRSPIASIQGYLETLHLMGDRLDADARARYLDRVLHNTQRLGGMVEELFQLARFDAYEVRLQREAFPLDELAQDVVAGFAARARAEGVQLSAPPAEGPVPVLADLGLVERVITNLIDNALRFTPAGGQVEVTTQAGPDGAHGCVADTGPGLPPEHLDKIFERFFRSDGARTGGGAGLGLAIAKQILDLHGGRIWAENRPDGGARFCFSLPPATAPARAPVPAAT